MDKQIDPAGIDGAMNYDELRELTTDLIEWPVELSPKTFDENDPCLDL